MELEFNLGSYFVLAFGLLTGSFLNVVIYRVPLGLSIISPRSACPVCKTPIRFYENIPVLSYLFLRGRCSHCQSPISIRYPIVELTTAILFLAAALKFGLTWHLLIHDLPFISLLVAICFIDLDHRIIPDKLSLTGVGIGLLSALFIPGVHFLDALIGGGVGFLAFYLPALVYEKWTGRMGLGGGDIKLLAMLGTFVGVSGVFLTVLVSSVLGSLIGLLVGWVQRKREGAHEGTVPLLKVSIPYGPFLVIGGLYAYLLADVLWSPFADLM